MEGGSGPLGRRGVGGVGGVGGGGGGNGERRGTFSGDGDVRREIKHRTVYMSHGKSKVHDLASVCLLVLAFQI